MAKEISNVLSAVNVWYQFDAYFAIVSTLYSKSWASQSCAHTHTHMYPTKWISRAHRTLLYNCCKGTIYRVPRNYDPPPFRKVKTLIARSSRADGIQRCILCKWDALTNKLHFCFCGQLSCHCLLPQSRLTVKAHRAETNCEWRILINRLVVAYHHPLPLHWRDLDYYVSVDTKVDHLAAFEIGFAWDFNNLSRMSSTT